MRFTLRIGTATAILLAAAVMAACAPTPEPGPSGAGVPPTSVAPTAGPDTPLPTATRTPEPSGNAGSAMLWPFPDRAAAAEWQKSFRSGGSQPWHLDSTATALGFTQGYLGFNGIDRVTSRESNGAEEWIGVGYAVPSGDREATAAELHLERIGAGEDAPWVVVGTRDTYLAVDTPAYGSAASWPLTVGGTVTGVDENLRVRVLGPGGAAADSCCAPAGGENARWTVQVPLQTPRTGDLTVVVATGGHVVDVERFAITAVRG